PGGRGDQILSPDVTFSETSPMARGPHYRPRLLPLAIALVLLPVGPARPDDSTPRRGVLAGRDAFGDWTTDAPGVRRKITIADLTRPFDSPSAQNHPRLV